MPAKKTDERQWYFKSDDGHVIGPFNTDTMRNRIVSGDAQASMPVSDDTINWIPAAAVPELGFECLALCTKGNIEVLGPFAREYLDNPSVMADIPRDSVFFVRSGTIGEVVDAPNIVGSPGSSLVERVVNAEAALRASESALVKAEATIEDITAARANEVAAIKFAAEKTAKETASAHEKEIVALKTMFAEAASAHEKQIEALVDEANRAVRETAESHKKEIVSLRAAAEEAAVEHEKTIAALKAESAKAAKESAARHEAEVAALKAEAEKTATAQAKQIEAREKEVVSLRAAAEEAAVEHEKTIASLKTEFAKTAKESAARHEAEIAALKAEAAKTEKESAARHEAEIAALKNSNENASKEFLKVHEKEVSALKVAAIQVAKAHEKEVETLRAEAAEAAKAHEKEIEALKAEVDALREEADHVAKTHAHELAAVRSDMEIKRKEADNEHARAIAELRTAAAEAARRSDEKNAEMLASANAALDAVRADADRLRRRLSELISEVSKRSDLRDVPTSERAASESVPPPTRSGSSVPPPHSDVLDGNEAVFVEAEEIDEPPPGFRHQRIHSVSAHNAKPSPEPRSGVTSNSLSGMAALENQLKSELWRAAGAAQGSIRNRDPGSRIRNLFKRK